MDEYTSMTIILVAVFVVLPLGFTYLLSRAPMHDRQYNDD